jgi:hypothetical protein
MGTGGCIEKGSGRGLARVPARSRIIDCAWLANNRALRRQMWTRAL